MTAFYFNPNIHPKAEYNLRLQNAEKAASNLNIDLLKAHYRPKDYFKSLSKENYPQRCSNCYLLRLEETAKMAVALGYEAFSTTLLVSPYQFRELLAKTGKKLAKQYELEFIDKDFRHGYSEGREMAKKLGLYLQNFCGCAYSYIEAQRSKIEARIK